MIRKHVVRSTSAAAALLLAAGFLIAGISGCDSGSPASAAPVTQPAAPVPVDTVRVVSRRLDMTVNLPGELQPFEEVRIFPRVSGFVQWIGVDRGSKVKKGQLLAILTAPEIVAQKAAAQSQLFSAENQRIAGEAKLAADQATWQRLKSASATPGVISDDELETAEKAAQADSARVVALRHNTDAARANLSAAQEMESYLRVYAPFDGVVTRRNVHPGALVGPATGSGTEHSMLRVEEVAHLRLVVAVPEAYVAGIEPGARVSFTVPAFPSRVFTGTIARVADSIDVSTRTMPVEADVWNPGLELSSGMFPQVSWPVHRPTPSLFVPQSAVARSADQAYLLRVRNGQLEQVDVTVGASVGNLTEVFGDVQAGDEVTLHPTDDLHAGMQVQLQERPLPM
ncbi:MAG TPA: efflux RND transporter periplasmic adaptor subunit [Acidobacteriaceae bacterium]|nr:efflux RND transporter periplasmic adaptor subunit [Acidobacteriaceae bacterium]